MRILIVEDEPIIAVNLQVTLVDWGHRPLLATSVAAAYDIWDQKAFDIALLDVRLPDGHIYGFATLLRENSTPFAILSGGEIELTKLPGDVLIIQKPYGLGELEAGVAALSEEFDKATYAAGLLKPERAPGAAGEGSKAKG